MAEVAFRPVRQLSEYKGKAASAGRELKKCHLLRSLTCRVKISFNFEFAITEYGKELQKG